MDLFTQLIWMYVLNIIVFPIIAWILAVKKNRPVAGWVSLTIFFGIFALVVLIFLPAKRGKMNSASS